MSKLYRINLKQESEKGITLNTTKCNILLDASLDPDIYTDTYKEYIDIEKILSLPYKLGCVSNKYNKCNIYINNRPMRRVLEGISQDKERGLYALVFPDVYIIMTEEVFKFLKIDNSSIGKEFREEFLDVFNQTAMNLDLISTKTNKLQINVNKIDETKYKDDELDDVFNMFSTKPVSNPAREEDLVVKIDENSCPFGEEQPKKPGRKKKTPINPGK